MQEQHLKERRVLKFPENNDSKLEKDKHERQTTTSDLTKGSEQENETFSDSDKKGLAKSLIDDDGGSLEDATLINSAINQGMGAFTPNMMFEKMVSNFRNSKNIYGESMIRATTGYDSEYIDKNIKYPEFQRELEKRMKDKKDEFKKKKLVDSKGNYTQKATELAVLSMYATELDNLEAIDNIHGKKFTRKMDKYGEKQEITNYKKGARFRDIAIRQSIKNLIRHNQKKLSLENMKMYERQSKGVLNIIYAIDTSSSMKGKKLESTKKAGLALAYKAISNKDKVGLIAFAENIITSIEPTDDFSKIVNGLTLLKPKDETDFEKVINEAMRLFPEGDELKHLVIITDAMPTAGNDPVQDTLQAISMARAANITISIVGMQLDEQGESLAQKIVQISEGKLYKVLETENLNQIVLQDYYAYE